jgi:hypothetical protein
MLNSSPELIPPFEFSMGQRLPLANALRPCGRKAGSGFPAAGLKKPIDYLMCHGIPFSVILPKTKISRARSDWGGWPGFGPGMVVNMQGAARRARDPGRRGVPAG